MKFAIELDGTESPDSVHRLHLAIDTLYDGASALAFAAPVISAGTAPPPPAPAPVADLPDASTLGFGAGAAATTTTAATSSPVNEAEVNAALAKLDLDSEGLPYDNRIHSPKPTKNAGDGKWKAKRGVDAATVEKIKGELLRLIAIPVGTHPAPAGTAPPPPPATTETAPPPPPPATTETAPPPPPAATPINANPDPSTFIELMTWVGPRTASGKLNPATISAAMISIGLADANGVGQLSLLMARQDLVPQAYAALKATAGE